LVISVPLTFFGGIGGAGRKGILIKGANYIEALAKVKTVVFDKTGTLTCGTFNVTGVYPVHYTEQQLLELAALAESYSNHPIAESICRAYGGRLDQTRIAKAKELSGRGTCVEIDGKYVLAGNGKLMEEFGISYHEYQSHGTVVYLAVNGVYAGCIVVSDLLKNDAATAIQQLKAAGVDKTVMLTGDLDQVGQSVGSELGIDEIYTQLLPDQKVEQVERLLSTFGTVAFVGDGINDAPVLTRADVGIAMGALGSDAAIEAADVVLMDDSPVKVAVAIKLARKTMAIVKQNIIFALGVKGLVLVLGALGLAGMWIAVFADVGVMVLAILNAMRALKN
jgi:Cd2+/Zn2+-exporting ATPase